MANIVNISPGEREGMSWTKMLLAVKYNKFSYIEVIAEAGSQQIRNFTLRINKIR
jgi:hypothetical protein